MHLYDWILLRICLVGSQNSCKPYLTKRLSVVFPFIFWTASQANMTLACTNDTQEIIWPYSSSVCTAWYSCVEANSAHGFTSAEHVILFVTYSNWTARSLQPELLAGVDKSITFLMTIPLVNPSMICDGVWYLDLSLRPLCYMQQPHKKPHLFPPYPFPNIIFSLLTCVLAYVLIVLACILTS